MKLSTNHELMEATATQYDTAHISSFFSRPRTDLEEGFEPQNSQRVSTLVIFYYINLTMAPIQPIFERARGNFIVFFSISATIFAIFLQFPCGAEKFRKIVRN